MPNALRLVFSKCAESMEEGRRLENLSWRLWNRETFCCESKPQFLEPPTAPRRPLSQSKEMPELSASVDSATSEVYERIQGSRSHSPNVHIKGLSSGKSSVDNFSVSKGKGKHTTSQVLERMVISIKETKITEKDGLTGLAASVTDALPTSISSSDSFPLATSKAPQPTLEQPARGTSEQRASQSSTTSTAPLSSLESAVVHSQTYGSDTSAELIQSHSVVRGFALNKISSSLRSQTHLVPNPSPLPIKQIPRPRIEEPTTKGGFILGGSSGEDDSSFDDQMSMKPRSSLTAGLKLSPAIKKTTSFKEEVESRTIANRSHQDEDVFESDEEDDDDDVDESAIEEEDEDSSDWEDSATDSGQASPTEKNLFKRVDSKPNLVSRRSLLTTMMHQQDRANDMAVMATKPQPQLQRSRHSTPNGPSVAASPEDESMLEMKGSNITRSKPIIMTTSNIHPPALSPRTTRRNMLATELTSSLRKHLLWERQQKNTTANAVLKRRHTAHDNLAQMKQYPSASGSGNTSKNNSWNHNVFDHGLGEYHSRGW